MSWAPPIESVDIPAENKSKVNISATYFDHIHRHGEPTKTEPLPVCCVHLYGGSATPDEVGGARVHLTPDEVTAIIFALTPFASHKHRWVTDEDGVVHPCECGAAYAPKPSSEALRRAGRTPRPGR